MAPRMHIETAEATEPEIEVGTTSASSTRVAAPAGQAPKPSIQVPKAKVDLPTEAAAVSVASPVPAKDATKTPQPVANAAKPAASGPKAAAMPSVSARPQVKVSPAVEEAPVADVEGMFEFAGDGSGRKAAGAPRSDSAPMPSAAENMAPKVKQGLMGWVRSTFPGHVHAFWGAVIAFMMALLTFAIGLPRMLLIAILVLIGIALGQVLDGDPKIIRTIRDLFSSDRER